jgi:lytic murein transglycosylase
MKIFRIFAALVLALSVASVCVAQDRKVVERQFRQWLDSEVWPAARARGVSRRSFETALGSTTPEWELPDLVPPGMLAAKPRQQSQAEFRAPSRYFADNVVNAAISGGRQIYAANKALLERIEAKTGVPGHIVIAIWGRESGYGRAAIPHDAFAVLATLAFMSERKDLFYGELLAALEMVDRYKVAPRLMKSSRAGALGQPQFLPSSFIAHAADGDGDGRADIWNSQADTIASIAAYLEHYGWVRGRDWGFEVTVPDSVPCYREGPDRGMPITDWVKLGIKRVNGKPFPAHELGAEGYLLMPAGRFGPAFIVTPNFYVLKDYNESDVYALFVGHVGDRIAFGVPPISARWQRLDSMLRSDVAFMQRNMEGLGYDVGGADGFPGYKTRRSVGEWQESNGRKPTCFPDSRLLREIR